MGQDVEQQARRIADEEPAHAAILHRRRIQNLGTLCDRP